MLEVLISLMIIALSILHITHMANNLHLYVTKKLLYQQKFIKKQNKHESLLYYQSNMSNFNLIVTNINYKFINITNYGFSLLSALFTLIFFSMCAGLIMENYLQIKKRMMLDHHLIKQYMNQLYIQSLLREKLHLVGYTPCMNIKNLELFDHRNNATKIDSIEYIDRINQLNNQNSRLGFKIKYMQPNNIKNNIANIIIADCFHAEIFSGKYWYAHQSDENLYRFKYDNHYMLGTWNEESYFIKNNTLYFQSHGHSERLFMGLNKLKWSTTFKENFLWVKLQLYFTFYENNIPSTLKARVWAW